MNTWLSILFFLFSIAVYAEENEHSFDYNSEIVDKLLKEADANDNIYKSVRLTTEAYNLAIQLKDTSLITKSISQHGYYITILKKYQEALKIYFEGLKYAGNNEQLKAVYYVDIGNCYSTLNDSKNAIKFYELALIQVKDQENYLYTSKILNNIGSVHSYSGEYDKSLEYLFKSLDIYEKNVAENDNDFRGVCYGNIGEVYFKKNDLKNAEIYIKKCKFYIFMNMKPRYVIWLYELESELNLKKRDYNLAIVYIDSAINLVNETNYSTKYLEVKKKKSEILFKASSYRRAYSILLKGYQFNDSITKYKEKNDVINHMDLHFKFSEQNKLLQLEKDNVILLSKANNYFKLLFGSIVLLLTLTTILFVVFAKYKIRMQKLNNEAVKYKSESIELRLDQNQKELTFHILKISSIKESMRTTISKMEILKKNVNPESAVKIHQLIKSINLNIGENDWKEFELRFKKIHTIFYNNLLGKYPSLTLNEKRLCALLKLDMTTKEISNITGQTERSIVVARSRLRSKLGITNDKVSLGKFINHI